MAKRRHSTARLSVIVPPETKARMEEIASRSQVPLARAIRQAVNEFIAKYTDRQLPLFDRSDELADEE